MNLGNVVVKLSELEEAMSILVDHSVSIFLGDTPVTRDNINLLLTQGHLENAEME
jgi:hypothetical protein